jgi:hypothetical protein
MKTLLPKSVFFLSIFIFLITNNSLGVTRYWVSAIAGNFNGAGNWSTTSGGAPVGGAPAAGDLAVFDGNGLGNCTITAAITQTTGGFLINATYTGTITVNPAINVVYGTAHFTQSGGTFNCGTGTFNSAAGAANFILNGGTFNRTAGTSNSAAGSITINGGTYNGAGGLTTLTAGSFTFNGGTYNGAAGFVTIINGAFLQTGGIFNCPTGTITFSNSFTKTAGTFNHNNGTVLFNKNATVSINSDATLVFNNLRFQGTGVSTDYNVVDSDIMEINGTLSFTGTSRMRITNGVLHAKGDITVTNTYAAQNTHTGTTLLINGTGNQTFTGAHLTNITGYLPTTQINKPSGNLIFANKICVEGNWIYNAGTLDYSTNSTSTVCFLYGKTFSGIAHDLGNVEFHTPGAAVTAINLNAIVVTVNGLLTLSGGTGQLQLTASTIYAKGDILITHTRTTSNSSTATILINGTTDQTITGTVTANQGRLPAVTINKPSGTLFLSNNVTIEGNYTYTAGTIDYTTLTNTVCFYSAGGTQNFVGSHNLGNVTFFGSAGNIYSLNGGMILTVNNLLTFAGASQFRITGGSVHAKGDISITNTLNGLNSHTGNLVINGTPDQTLTSTALAGRGRLPNITINKASGNLFLAGNISTEGNWTYIAGTVDPQTSTVHAYQPVNIDGEGATTMDFYNLTFPDGLDKTLTGNVGVLNRLSLNNSRLVLNANTIFIKNSATNAITYNPGFGSILSENTGNNGKVSWDINTTTGAHNIPFQNSFADELTFTFDLTAGDAGNVTVSTYPTAADNTPFPITPQLVTNVDAFGGIDNSLNTVNRFWQIDETGPDPTATLTFQYSDAEVDGSEAYNAQRYDEVTDIWQPALPGQTVDNALNTVVVPDVTTFSPWTLSTVATPLDIDMISYNVVPSDKSVDVSWGIFNEANIIGYEIQKTENFDEVITFETVEVNNGLYEISDEQPLNGISYYRVVAKMINGEEEYFDWKKAIFTNEGNNLFKAYPNPIGGGQTLYIESKESEVNFVQLNDLTGKIMYSTETASQGNILQITLPEDISQGCYILTVNDKKTRLIIR